jgi:hypothetical protein
MYRLEYTEQPTTIVYLSLNDERLIPDEITRTLGVQPDKAWKKGDPIRPRNPTRHVEHLPLYTFGCWRLNAPCSQYDESEDQIDQLLLRIEALPPAIHDYIRTYDGTIVVGFSSGESNFGFYLSPEQIQRMTRLGLGIVFDIYPIRPDSA